MFWIYENWQTGPHKAVIHREECGHCNQGDGVRGGSDPSHGQWHGSYETVGRCGIRFPCLSGRISQNQLQTLSLVCPLPDYHRQQCLPVLF